jgi:PPOX class probable F420-dependent enzyme
MRRDPRVSLLVDDEEPPFAFVLVRGTAELSTDPDQLLAWATRIGGRYMGADRAEEFGRRNAAAEELLVRILPDQVIAETDIAGY